MTEHRRYAASVVVAMTKRASSYLVGLLSFGSGSSAQCVWEGSCVTHRSRPPSQRKTRYLLDSRVFLQVGTALGNPANTQEQCVSLVDDDDDSN